VAGKPGEEGLLLRIARLAAGLLLSSLVIELVLMPIALAHFGRAGLYGMVANMAAIPLTAFIVMPLLGLWLLLSSFGLGVLIAWALVPALELLAGIGTTVAAWPGAALAVPAFPMWTLGLMAAGGLIGVLLAGPLRWCCLPLLLAGLAFAALDRRPTLFVSGDGRQIALVADGDLYLLRGHREGFLVRAWRRTADSTDDRRLADLPGARCDPIACKVPLEGGMTLLAFVRPPPDGNQLEQLCREADIITAPAVLPASCAGRWRTLDRAWLRAHGAAAIDPGRRRITTVADQAGDQPWSPAALPGWRPRLLGPPAWTGVITE
jgi:competence protein ComEC